MHFEPPVRFYRELRMLVPCCRCEEEIKAAWDFGHCERDKEDAGVTLPWGGTKPSPVVNVAHIHGDLCCV